MARHDHNPEDLARLSAWLDGELDAAADEQLEARLEREPALRGQAGQLEALDRLLADWPAPAHIPDLRPAVLARVEASLEPWHRRLWMLPWRHLAPTAGWAMAGVLAGFMMLPLMPQHRTMAQAANEDMMLSMTLPRELVLISDFHELDVEVTP